MTIEYWKRKRQELAEEQNAIANPVVNTIINADCRRMGTDTINRIMDVSEG